MTQSTTPPPKDTEASLPQEEQFRLLLALNRVTSALSRSASIDEFCRAAVELGRKDLEFDRMGLWLFSHDGQQARGTFGTDGYGETTDERGDCLSLNDFEFLRQLREGRSQFQFESLTEIHQDGKYLGQGEIIRAPMNNGEAVIGFLSADNLLSSQAMDTPRHQLLQLYANSLGHLYSKLEAEQLLREHQQEMLLFEERLRALYDVSNLLSAAPTLDELCRLAVVLGREHLRFDRLGLWFLDEGADELRGSFGTDESGNLRDERHLRSDVWRRDLSAKLLNRDTMYDYYEDEEVTYFGRYVGRGAGMTAPLWDGEKVLGIISMDNLLHRRPVTEYDRQLFCLYADALGHACSRKKNLDALRQSREQYRALVENINLGVVLTDTQDTVLMVNETQCRLFDRARAEVLGKPYHACFSPQDGAHPRVVRGDAVSTEPGDTGYVLEHRVTTGTGQETKLLQVRTFPMLDDERRVVGYIDVTEDVTREKHREHERLLLNQAIEQAEESLLLLALDMTIQYVNPAFERLTLFKREAIIGQPVRSILPEPSEPDFYPHIRQSLERGENWRDRITLQRTTGSMITLEYTVSPVRDTQGTHVNYVAILRDVTQQQELERQLLHSQRMEAVGRLAGGVAHDFNNLLQAIQGYVDMAMEQAPEDGPVHHDLREARRAVHRATALVRQLLTFSRKETLHAATVDLGRVVTDLAKMMRRVIGEHIELTVIAMPNLSHVKADAGQMEQVLLNLCVNARDAMPLGGALTIHVKNTDITESRLLHQVEMPAGSYVELIVTDSGMGMPPDMLDRIFEPFFTTKEVGEGTGLGLSIVYGIVRQHDGFITVDSQQGRGTKFHLFLAAQEPDAPTESVKEERAFSMGGNETILLAEDDDLVRNLATKLLRRAGYRLIVAEDGEEAIRLLETHVDDIDIAVLDIIMPKVGGKGVWERIRQLRPAMPIIFCSGYGYDSLHADVRPDEEIELIQKPYHPKELLRRIRTILERPGGPA